MVKLLICLFVFGAIFSYSDSKRENLTCDYNVLKDAIKEDHNKFLLQTTFFPPDVDSPVYVTVTYNFSTSSVDYVWSTATLYFILHPHIIGYLSLFFSYIESYRVAQLELHLPEKCSFLANNTNSDATNFLFTLTHRLQYYTQDSSDLEDIRAYVVASEKRKKDHQGESSVLFLSLSIGLPIAALVLVWVSVHGAFPYIRCYLNDSENFPSIAAFYWIGQTFSIFVIVMDIIALVENSKIEQHNSLEAYQTAFISLIVVAEILGLSLSIVVSFITLFSHTKDTKCKHAFEAFVKCFKCLIGCGLLFKDIGRKEARAWLFTSSLITPIIALSSHAGFIIRSWVSYKDRSIAMILLYILVFLFLYWQYMYRFSTVIIHLTLRGNEDSLPNDAAIYIDDANNDVHYENELYANAKDRKFIGIDTPALFLMLLFIIFVYGIILYFAAGVFIFLLSSIDQALIELFKIGNDGFVVIVFFLTYKIFSISNGGVNGGLISNDALRYWRFLNSNGPSNKQIKAVLEHALKQLLQTLESFKPEDRKKYTEKLKERKFDLEVVAKHLRKAQHNGSTLEPAAKKFKEVTDHETINLEDIEDDIRGVQRKISEAKLTSSDKVAAKELRDGINHFRKTLVKVLGVPPMFVNSDKASALVASLLYQMINTLPLEQRLQLLSTGAGQGSPQSTGTGQGSPQPRGPEQGSPQSTGAGQCSPQSTGPGAGQGSPQSTETAQDPPQSTAAGQGSPQSTGAGQLRRPEDNERYLLLLSLIAEEF